MPNFKNRFQQYKNSQPYLSLEHDVVNPAATVQNDLTNDFMKIQGVMGTAIHIDDNQNGNLTVYVNNSSINKNDIIRQLPKQHKGVNIQIEYHDEFKAFSINTVKQTLPIQLGTSGGWNHDLASGYCCGGTLGSLVKANGFQYIMSNYHVFEADIVAGGNNFIANTNDSIIQPALIDVNCNVANSQVVATLVKLSSLPSSNVDVSVAKVVSGKVNVSGSILSIGIPSKNILAPSINQSVKKSARTSGLTTSKISGLNATVSVAYDNECAGSTAFTKTFTGQIIISNTNSSFLRAGDSGGLLLENVINSPRAIGLLFAGSNTLAVANPISQVLAFLTTKLGGTVTMVGK